MRTTRNIRVVIAEDESLVAQALKSDLASIGFTVLGIAGDGMQAVDMTYALKPDVVIMDINMPTLDGLAGAIAIQEGCPTPVVILTAHADPKLVYQASLMGVGAYLLKPASAMDLERAITIAMARHADLMKLQRLNRDLKDTLADVKTLKGVLPICSGCKKIRDDKGNWNEVEGYVMAHTEAKFTHDYCPQCAERYSPEFSKV